VGYILSPLGGLVTRAFARGVRSMTSLRIIFAGAGEFGIPTLRALRDAGHEIVRVITQPDRPAGRGRALSPTPLAQAALDLGLDVHRTADINKETLPPADVMVVIAFGQKIGEQQVHHPRLGSVNLHSSRLPRHRGAAPINWAILSGDRIAGNSIIRLAAKMDAGAVLAQSELPIGELETAGELHDRLAADGAPLMLRVLDDLASGRAVETPQDDSLATLAGKLSRESAVIDWTRPAEEIARRIRGLYPWPGVRVKLCDAEGKTLDTLRLVRARPTASNEASRWSPGEVMTTGHVRAGDGDRGVEIIEVQPDGKRPMPLADYRRGHRWVAGMRLERA
jgi:methionyl-tRNA formyltransferase